jgi:hypothetical protein
MIVGSNILAGASGQGGYFLQRSIRLRRSASANFTRTPSVASNRKTWTWSAWVKRGVLDSINQLFNAYGGITDNLNTGIYFGADNKLVIYGQNQNWRITTQVFRDPSSWYHLIIVLDTTNATATDRIKIYVNGVQVTTFDTSNAPALNADLAFNSTNPHIIGIGAAGSGNAFDGYLTEINFIDGQALTPTSFGEFNTLTGVWQPKKYGGTYGTNGFYLNFNDNSAATAAAIGKDNSGNGNNWTPNNISVTAGVTYDSMTDVPTLTSPTTANYSTLNPIASSIRGQLIPTLSNGNLTAAAPAGGYIINSTIGLPLSGKYYYEVFVSAVGTQSGIEINTPFTANYVDYYSNGNKDLNGVSSAYGSSWTTNDIIGVAIDCDFGSVTYYKNNVSQGAITFPSGVAAGRSNIGLYLNGATLNINFGQRPFSYTPPTGFVALNTYNLPTPTISNGAAQFAATLYTGNGTTQTITNGGNNPIGITFQPDFVWMKNRTIAQIHGWFDSVRGVGNLLSSDQTSVESSGSAGVSSFNSNGFGLGNVFNNNTNAFVAWQWKASNAAAVTNTSGTISSQVSANPTAGFSVVTYTGTGTNGATFGHGLGVAPAFGIWKVRSGTVGNWVIYHQSLGATRGLNFTTGAATTSAVFFNNTAPTSTVWSLGTVTDVNRSTSTYVNYAFSEIAGYSKFGSYTGNGSADGVFVYLGFRPRWLLIKRTDSTGGWNLYDSTRNPYNVADLILQPNNSNAEASGITFPSAIDFLSNGFKTRNYDATYGPNINANGGTYIYAAFAENPTKFALAR